MIIMGFVKRALGLLALLVLALGAGACGPHREQTTAGNPVARLSALHLVRFISKSNDFSGYSVDSNYRRFIDNHTSTTNRDNCVCRSHIDRH